jgi:hypothetical protein
MIQIIIILEDGSSFNYFNKDIYPKDLNTYKEDKIAKTEFCIQYRGTKLNSIAYKTDSESLRNKVLDLLHKEVARCFPLVQGELLQNSFQVYISDVITKANKELEVKL